MRTFYVAALALALASAAGPAVAQSSTPAPAAGGAFARSSVEGCMNQPLFNGIWRLTVLSVDPAATFNDGSTVKGVGVKVKLSNGTTRQLAPDETGFSNINGQGIDLAFSDENTSPISGVGTGYAARIGDKKLPPGGSTTAIWYFNASNDPAATPTKLLIAVDPKASTNYAKVHYSVKSPSFRVHLDCTK